MDQDMVIDHTRKLAEIDARAKSNTKMLDCIEQIVTEVHEMNKNIAVIAKETQQQGEQLQTLVDTLKIHEEKIDNIEEKMETKDTVARLHERVDELERKDGRNAERLLGQIKWLLISLIIAAAFGLAWSKVI